MFWNIIFETENFKHLKLKSGRNTREVTDLPDGHGAENVQEDERALREVFAWKISMSKVLNQWNRLKWKESYDTSIKSAVENAIRVIWKRHMDESRQGQRTNIHAVEHAEKSGENEPDG